MPKWREVDSRAVRLGPYAAAITGAGLAWFSVFISIGIRRAVTHTDNADLYAGGITHHSQNSKTHNLQMQIDAHSHLGGRLQYNSTEVVWTDLVFGADGRQAGVVRIRTSDQGPLPPAETARTRNI